MHLKKPVWLILSLLIALITVLASCGDNAAKTTAATTVAGQTTNKTTVAAATVAKTTATTAAENPKYGGVINYMANSDVMSFDTFNPWSCQCYSLQLTNEFLLQGDWSKGPAGTGECSWITSAFDNEEAYMKSGLCESWEMDAAKLTITWNIRQGIYFTNKAPANGRELTADDVAATINRAWASPMSFVVMAYPAPLSAVATGKYTVVTTFKTLSDLGQDINQIGGTMCIFPKEAVTKFGDMQDWHNSCGTGPFILTDYVKGSTITLVRNANYWDTDPVGPGKGNQLPYVDRVNILIISDTSTEMAAIRTGKADTVKIGWENALSLLKTNPDLGYVQWYVSEQMIFLREDKADMPWNNQTVRQALIMGTDYKTIVDDYYNGNAEWYAYPCPVGNEWKDLYVPFNELPANVQKLYSYDPTTAAQMIKDAGYPNGFSIDLITQLQDNYGNSYVDLLSIIKDQWAKIGVTLNIQPKENAVYNSMMFGGTYEQGLYSTYHSALSLNMDEERSDSIFNSSKVNDAYMDEVHRDIWNNYGNWDKICELYKGAVPYILEKAWNIPTPSVAQYVMWQPWLKDYHGELGVGNCAEPNFPKWIWIDQDMKMVKTGTK